MLSIQSRSSAVVKVNDFDDTNFSDVIKRLKQFDKQKHKIKSEIK
jgi:hypothetical protein